MEMTTVANLPASPPAADAAIRYAIYFAPRPESTWWNFGSAWLGRDAATGMAGSATSLPLPMEFHDAERTAMVDVPRQYGFHATLKPPFRLAVGCTPADVYFQAAMLAPSLNPLCITPLSLAEIGPFVGLRAPEADAGLMRLAAQCVVTFDYLRALPDVGERQRRQQAGLTSRQTALLNQWGYPYVFDEFLFHLTLTNRLSPETRARVMRILLPLIDDLNCEPLVLDALVIFEQHGNAPFRMTRRYGFNGAVEIYGDD